MPLYKMQGKKDGKQKYRVRINYMDNLGKSKQIDRVAYGLEDAKQLERELNYKIKEEPMTKKMNVQTLYDEFIVYKQYEIRETTLDKSKRQFKLHILPTFENVKLEKLQPPVLQKWKRDLSEKGLAIKTKQNIFSEFRSMLNYAVKMEYINSNPLNKVGNFKSSIEIKKPIEYYTSKEFLRYIYSAKKIAEAEDNLINWGYYVFFYIAFFTGLRKGEINALQWTDIKDGYLSVTKSLAQKLKGGDRITPPKNKSSIRTIQLPKPLIEVLGEHYKRCEMYEGFNDNFLICGGVKALRDTSLQNANARFATMSSVKQIRIHDFRHSHASLLANEGINIQEIARRLGHTKISMTWDTYSHLYPREEERAINILDKIV